MNTVFISVIVPIYNVDKYLEQCLESILNQSHKNLEVLCINDGSTDGSLDILKRFEAQDARVRVISKENGGYGAACNLGLRKAQGEWISIIEPDDWIAPNMYKDMLALAASVDGPVDIVKTPWIDVCNWDDPVKQHNEPGFMVHRYKTSTRPFELQDEPSLIETHPSIWSAIYRAQFLRDKGIQFVEYPGAGWADNPFLIETFCQANAIMYLDQAYYYYRCDLPGSTLNHTSDEAVVRPFERWLDMNKILQRLGVVNLGIMSAHYLRGFNYVKGAIHDDGWENPLVQQMTAQVFNEMNASIVASSPKLSSKQKAFYAEVTGRQLDRSPLMPRIAYLASEATFTLRNQGLRKFFRRAWNLVAHR